ncbi:LysR substrate-binding domain-containing protein [Aliiroseovarius sp. 2305UL8-7]|uniref:LysR substrate-binding domain-containing protein n=1 Tax=Aliiroseovarius conchicola TaxID=3121637 RepID=UPI0035287818
MQNLRRTLPSLNNLYVVEAVSRHLNFSHAANELAISQPAVSKSIRQLEQNLGVQLFVRQHRGLSLTTKGDAFANQIRAALIGVDQATRQIQSSGDGQTIRINVSSSFVSMWLVPRIAEFRSQNPSTLFEITENHGDLGQHALAACDFTTRIGMGDWNDAHSWRLARERLYALASPEYAAAHPECMQLKTLQQANLIHATEPNRSRMGWSEWFEAAGVPFSGATDVLFSDHHSAIHAALVGQGVTLGWQHLVGDYLQEGRLVRVADTMVQTEQSIYLISPRDRVLQPHHLLFRDWVVAQFQRDNLKADETGLTV